MAIIKKYYTGFDVRGTVDLNNNALKQVVIENLSSDPTGYAGKIYYNTTSSRLRFYNGSSWADVNPDLDVNLMNYKGAIDPTGAASAPASKDNGDVYISNAAGSVDSSWTNISGQAIQVGDFIIYDGSKWDLIQGNIVSASESTAGIAEIATQVETDAGTDDERFITPLKLATWKSNKKVALGYSTTVSLTADTPATITHSLGTQNVSVATFDSSGEEIGLGVVVTGDTTITVASNVSLSNVKVVVKGF